MVFTIFFTKCSHHISASVRLRNKIPTDTNVWAPGIQRCYSVCCALQTEVGNSRWRPPNRVETRSTYTLASRPDSNAVPTVDPPFSESSNAMAILRIVPDVTGSRFLKMAATMQEALISQLLDQIETPFQRLIHHFRGPATQLQ